MIEANGVDTADISSAQVVPIRRQDPIEYVRSNGKSVRITYSALAKILGWDRMSLKRHLQRLQSEKVLELARLEDGRTQITLLSDEQPAIKPASATVRVLRSALKVIANLSSQVQFGMSLLLGLVMIAFAVWMAWQAAQINAVYGESLGRDEFSRTLFGRMSMVGDAIAFVLPAVAAHLWERKRWFATGMAWVMFFGLLAYATNASLGFAAVNIADSGSARTQAVSERKGLETQIADLRKKQTEILGRPSRNQNQVNANKEAADNVKAELAEKDKELKALPAMSDGDPQANMGAKVVAFWTRGSASVGPEAFEMFRVTFLSILPQIAGLVLMFGEMLLGGRRHG